MYSPVTNRKYLDPCPLMLLRIQWDKPLDISAHRLNQGRQNTVNLDT